MHKTRGTEGVSAAVAEATRSLVTKASEGNSKMASSPAKNSSDKMLLELIDSAQKQEGALDKDKDLDVFEFRAKANDPDSEVAAPCDHAKAIFAHNHNCVARPQGFERMREGVGQKSRQDAGLHRHIAVCSLRAQMSLRFANFLLFTPFLWPPFSPPEEYRSSQEHDSKMA